MTTKLSKKNQELLDNFLESHKVLPYKGNKPKKMIEWAEALESGAYKQCGGQLRQDDKFCCLGVLCDISNVASWKGDLYSRKNAMPPTSVAKKFGIGDATDEFFNVIEGQSGTEYGFTYLNDTTDLPFKVIAAIIRKHVDATLVS